MALVVSKKVNPSFTTVASVGYQGIRPINKALNGVCQGIWPFKSWLTAAISFVTAAIRAVFRGYFRTGRDFASVVCLDDPLLNGLKVRNCRFGRKKSGSLMLDAKENVIIFLTNTKFLVFVHFYMTNHKKITKCNRKMTP